MNLWLNDWCENNPPYLRVNWKCGQEASIRVMHLIMAAYILDEWEKRITYLGWKSPEELDNLLCAADIYFQPGTQSATMQASLGARCAVVLDDVVSHKPFVLGNGWLLNKNKNCFDVMEEIEKISRTELDAMQLKSFKIAQELLDYKKLAEFFNNKKGY